jgi:hypothetical protein
MQHEISLKLLPGGRLAASMATAGRNGGRVAMESKDIKAAGRAAGSMVWLCLLYGGLLYLSVGALGVADLIGRIGASSANVVHIVNIAHDIRDQEQDSLNQEKARLGQMKDQLGTAIKEMRDYGVSAGLALQDIQPIVETYGLAPKLADLLKRPVSPDMEMAWAERMARVMALQIDMEKLRKSMDRRHALLRANWTSFPAVEEEARRANLSPSTLDLAANTADTLQGLGYGLLFDLPAEILTLLLALSMGALGSTLHITKTMLSGSDPRELSYYLIRPFQGMVTSLVVFVLLKAGQMTVSAGDSDTLNIYFVAFAGIAAGLLADEAYRMICKAGAGIIKNDEEARWAFKLKTALAERNETPAALADGIGVSLGEVTGWISEIQAVPPQSQRLIATWLRIPDRELFTSQPPDQKAGQKPDEAPAPAEAVPAPASHD